MKFLISILILLFVLTTLGFSGIAYAATSCEVSYFENSPYERETYEDASRYEVEFINSQTAYFNEGQRRIRDERQWEEFTDRVDNEFNYNDNF